MEITPAPQPGNPPPVPARPELTGDAETWKNRYEAMHGRFREASRQLEQQNDRLEALENMLATMQTAPAPQPQQHPTQTPKFLTPKDEEEMGTEMIDFVRRAAREEVAPLTSLQQEIAKIKQQLDNTVQTSQISARQRMHNELNAALPNWNEINHDPDFHAWLALQDQFSGVNRKKLLTQAYAQNDTARVLAFFKGFVSETAAQRPASLTEGVAPAAEQPGRPTLEDLAAPGRARTAASPQAPAEKQIIRTSDINAFYAAVRRGAYKGREELKAQHEAELHAAMREGRIVQDT